MAIGEDQIIRKISRMVPSAIGSGTAAGRRADLSLGIGDDAAVLKPRSGTEWVLSCDAFLEGVHFLAERHPPESVGYKALARATSDLAAMGATPRFFMLTLALPAERTGKWLDGFANGMAGAARELEMKLIGGDTSRLRSVSISLTVIGEIAVGRAVGRAGARPGDILCVSGKLGEAQLGLEIVRDGVNQGFKNPRSIRQWPLRRHLFPSIRVRLGEWLAQNGVASAMIDVSDGLSTDLSRLCAASGVAARLWPERIPRVTVPASLERLRLDQLRMALHGGDDYELLFTVPARRMHLLRKAPQASEITAMGEIERGRGVLLVGADGRPKLLKPRGWDSFRAR